MNIMNIIWSDNIFWKVFHYNYMSFCVYVTYMLGYNWLLEFLCPKKNIEIQASYVELTWNLQDVLIEVTIRLER